MAHERWFDNGVEFQIVWEVNTISSPEGATVVVVNFNRPAKRIIYRATGAEHELDRLLYEGKKAAHVDSLNRSKWWPKPRKKSA
jgi:hypothetical protein